MALTDLIDLGYEIVPGPGGDEDGSVRGHGRVFHFGPETDLDTLEQEARNHAALMGKLEQAQAFFATNYADWASLTAQQKDTANRQAQRALANLIRHVRNDLTSAGI